MKHCNKCNTTQSISQFDRSKDGKNGLGSLCKTCKLYANRYRVFGVTKNQVESMLDKQNNKCALCRREFGKRFEIDHDHTSGKVRGLLCMDCNTGLGKLGDTLDSLNRAVVYLSN